MHQILFRWGFALDKTMLGSLQRSPNPLAGFKRPTSKGREGRGVKGKGGEGRGGKGRGRNVEFHHLLLSNLTTGFRHPSLRRFHSMPACDRRTDRRTTRS